MSSLWREKYAQLEFCFVLLCVQEHEAAMYSRECGEPGAQSVTSLYFLHCLLPFFQCSDFLLIIPRSSSVSDSVGIVTPQSQGGIAAQVR